MAIRSVTPINDIYRLDRDVADSAILDPRAADALEAGEFLLEGSTGWDRIAGTNAAARATARGAEMVFGARGEAPTQALGKVATFSAHEYIVETDIFDDGMTPAVNGQVVVCAISVGGVTRCGFDEAANGETARGIIQLPLPANNDGFLRVKVTSPFTAVV